MSTILFLPSLRTYPQLSILTWSIKLNHQKHYDLLIIKAQSRIKPNCYCESHHIIPKALGGSNDTSNLVWLTAREHFIAHLLLAKIHGGSMWLAANIMLSKHVVKSSRLYALVKSQNSINQTGKKHSIESKLKIGDSRTGSKHPLFKGIIKAIRISNGQTFYFDGRKSLNAFGLNHSCVYKCISGSRFSHQGFKFYRV